MAGETTLSQGICLDIAPWSKASHVTTWLTPNGKVPTIVKGAQRPKSQFLGQYDLNYTCEILFYTNSHSDLHALKECTPLELRENLRLSYKSLALAGYFRSVASKLCPYGKEAEAWFKLLGLYLDKLMHESNLIHLMTKFDLEVLSLSGINPNFRNFDDECDYCQFSIQDGHFNGEGKSVRISKETAIYLSGNKSCEKNIKILLEATRVISVYYNFHIGSMLEMRRLILNLISERNQGVI
jgi:DNA repair protein RecO